MRLLFIFTVALFLISCHTHKLTEQRLAEYHNSASYLHTSKIDSLPKKDTICVRLNKIALNQTLKATRQKKLFVPLVIFNYRRVHMNITLGQSSLTKPYKDFFLESFIEETRRTGSWLASEKEPNENQYTVDVSIDSCYTQARYRRTLMIIFPINLIYFIRTEKQTDQAETTIIISAKLSKGTKLVSEKSYTFKKSQRFFKSDLYKGKSVLFDNLDRRRTLLLRNMTESLSLTTKECIEKVVFDINNSLIAK